MATRPRASAVPLATLSLAAAAIHFAVVPEHVLEYAPFGMLFLGLGWFQTFWAVAYVMGFERRLTLTAIVVNVGAAAVWLWSRTLGLPFGPEPFVPEGVGGVDVVANIEEVVLVGLLLRRATRPRPAEEERSTYSAWRGAILWSGLVVFVTSIVLLEPPT